MSDLLKKVAQLLGVPESLIQRSSEARAEASGKSTDEVLQSWAGGEPVAEEPATEEPVTSVKNATVPEPSWKVIVLSAVGSVTASVVS